MSFIESLLSWANLPFSASIATVLTFAALQASGLLGLLGGGEGDHDADMDLDADADVDHDIDHDADHGQHSTGILATVGVGRLPTTIVWQTFAMSFGLAGIVTNSFVLMTTHHLPVAALLLSVPLALAGGFALTAAIARMVATVVKPPSEATSRRDLVGLPGVVVSGQVDEHFGEIRVKVFQGDYVQVPCRVLPGETAIEHHQSIVIVKYDRVEDRLYVAPNPADSSEVQSTAVRVRG
jgi:hypothetical protein